MQNKGNNNILMFKMFRGFLFFLFLMFVIFKILYSPRFYKHFLNLPLRHAYNSKYIVYDQIDMFSVDF